MATWGQPNVVTAQDARVSVRFIVRDEADPVDAEPRGAVTINLATLEISLLRYEDEAWVAFERHPWGSGHAHASVAGAIAAVEQAVTHTHAEPQGG